MASSRRTGLTACTISLVACAFTLVAWVAPVQAQSGDAIRSILEKAIAATGDRASIQERLRELEAVLNGKAPDPLGEYSRAWMLSHVGRGEESVAAYARAIALKPDFADAWYNAGVVLKDLGRDAEAVERWKGALNVDPAHVDAAYNLGQTAYDQKDFVAALKWFQKAHTLVPDDFNATKKVLQAQNALAQWDDAAVTRQEVYRLRRVSTDPTVRALTRYCFDQFDVDKVHVFAYEIFEPAGADALLYSFVGADAAGVTLGEITAKRDGPDATSRGAVVLQARAGGETIGEPSRLDTLPSYPALKERLRALVRTHILPLAKAPGALLRP